MFRRVVTIPRSAPRTRALALLAAVLLPLAACAGGDEPAPPERALDLGTRAAALSATDLDGDITDLASALPDSMNPRTRIEAYRESKEQGALPRALSARSAASPFAAGTDTLADYAAKCDNATGIHVPPLNCNSGVEIPQGQVQTTLTETPIGIATYFRQQTVTVNEIRAAGTDIWGNSDQFLFAHTNNLGGGQPDGTPGGVDGYAEVLVTSLGNTNAFAKAGIMFRSSLSAGSINVMLAITPTSGALLQQRTATNGTSTNAILAGRAAPTWLRLVRRTNTFTGYVSTDRVTWTQVGSPVTLTGFSTNPYVGMAVTSHSAGVQTTAFFDKFSWTPLSAFSACDQPNALHQTCDPGSRFQVLAQNQEAVVVANCRKQGVSASTPANQYGDVAIIQYNKFNGAICFYQAYGVTTANAMPAPSTGSGPWLPPDETHAGGCTGCHDNGAFIKSRYLTQLNTDTFPSKPFLIPHNDEGYDNDYVPLRYVGNDFADDRSWSVDAEQDPQDADPDNCNDCHRLSVNNVVLGAGTAGHLAPLATAATFGLGFKTQHSAVSPIWMRPDQVVWDEFAERTASNFSSCANDYWPSSTPGFPVGNDPGAACDYEELGSAWFPPSDAVPYTDVNIGISGATRSSSGTVDTVNAAGADIFGSTDQFLYSYKLASGDGQATVKVNSLTNTNAFAKAGIMFRHTNAGNAVNTMVAMTPTSGAHFQYRNAVGGSTTSFTLAGHSNPRWLKLARAGRSFVGYVSSDQQTWTQVGTPITLPAANFPEGSLAQVGLAVTSHNAGASAQAVFDHFAWLPASPDTLVDANIGITNGSHSFRKGTHTIQAGGADIYGTSDQFFYAFQSDAGTGTISARVTGIGNTDPYAKAGVMYRNSSAENSAHVMMEITAAQGAIFQYRTSPGASATSVIVAGHSAPKYVRIVRSAGGLFTGSVSSDGSTWTQIGSVTIPAFNDPALVGLAVTSHNTGAVTTATFTDVVLP